MLTELDLYRSVNRDLFTGKGGNDHIGLELELFAVSTGTDGEERPLRLDSDDGAPALLPWLRSVALRHGWSIIDSPYGAVEFRMPEGGQITLEPAGQVEYSGPALPTVSEAVEDLERVTGLLENEGAEAGIRFVACGYYPAFCGEEPDPPIAKPRYRIMDQYFQSIGPFGRRMMRSTCALQINLDFGSPEVAHLRWRLANMIAPSLNALFANSPCTVEGRHYRSYRYEIWCRLDPSRTGRLFDRPDLDPVADYLRFALDASVMLVGGTDAEFALPRQPMTFREWMRGTGPDGVPDQEDWRIHLSTLFPDVRPRGWMEIRAVDALPRRWWGVPVALTATLLYNEALLRRTIGELERLDRSRQETEHEHDGYWASDFRTGLRLLRTALPFVDDPRFSELMTEYLRMVEERTSEFDRALFPSY